MGIEYEARWKVNKDFWDSVKATGTIPYLSTIVKAGATWHHDNVGKQVTTSDLSPHFSWQIVQPLAVLKFRSGRSLSAAAIYEGEWANSDNWWSNTILSVKYK